MNLNSVQVQRNSSRSFTLSCSVQFYKLCGAMHQVQETFTTDDRKPQRSFASFKQTLAISPLTMTSSAAATISRTSEVGKSEITTLFSCSQSTVPSFMRTNLRTVGFICGSSWISRPTIDTRSTTSFPVGLSQVRISPKISTRSSSLGYIMSALCSVKVYKSGMLQ